MSVSFSTVVQKLRAQPNAATSALNDYVARLAPTTLTKLSNGFQVASESAATFHPDFATIGVVLQAGSAYEGRTESGVASMLQKLCLGRVGKKTHESLAHAIEDVGGHLKLSSQRDRTLFYFKCHKSQLEKAVALLAEMVRSPLISEEEVEKVRTRQLQELKEFEEDPDGIMMDNLHTACLDSTERGYGAKPKGTLETVPKITSSMLEQYHRENWTAGRAMLLGVGGVNHAQLESWASKYFSDLPESGPAPPINSRYVGGDIKFWNTRMKLTHYAWAFETCGADCGDVVPLELVNHIHGRFHRSQHDLVQHSNQLNYKCFSAMNFLVPTLQYFNEKGIEIVNPFFHCYEDVGLSGLHLVARTAQTLPEVTSNISDYVQLTMGEYCRLTQKAIHARELEQAKVNYKVQLLMNRDGLSNRFEDLSRELFYVKRSVPVQEMFARIDDLTPTNLMEVLQHYFYSRRPVLSYTGYVADTPGYDQVTHWTYKYLY